ATVLVCVAGGLSGCLAVAAVVGWAAWRGTAERWPLVAAAFGGPVVAAVVVAARPWPANDLNLTSWGIQTLVWLGVSASLTLVAAADGALSGGVRGRRRARRMTGRSTA